MPSRQNMSKSVPFNVADMANVAKANPYVQRLIEDQSLRENIQKAFGSSKSAYGRLADGETSARAVLEDKKLQGDLREALEAVRDAALALSEEPRRRARKGKRVGRTVLIVGLGSGLALVGSEKLRSKVLDTLFGKEEEFEYTPPPPPPSASPPASPVSAA
jgi:hypothetical protein